MKAAQLSAGSHYGSSTANLKISRSKLKRQTKTSEHSIPAHDMEHGVATMPTTLTLVKGTSHRCFLRTYPRLTFIFTNQESSPTFHIGCTIRMKPLAHKATHHCPTSRTQLRQPTETFGRCKTLENRNDGSF